MTLNDFDRGFVSGAITICALVIISTVIALIALNNKYSYANECFTLSYVGANRAESANIINDMVNVLTNRFDVRHYSYDKNFYQVKLMNVNKRSHENN